VKFGISEESELPLIPSGKGILIKPVRRTKVVEGLGNTWRGGGGRTGVCGSTQNFCHILQEKIRVRMVKKLDEIPLGTAVFIDAHIFHLYLRGPGSIRNKCTRFLERGRGKR
jgi:hypothetical protein